MNIKENVLWDHEDLVVNLIKNDIIHERLIYGLKQITLDVNSHNLTLNKAILWHMGVWDMRTYQNLLKFYLRVTVKAKKQKKALSNLELEDLSRDIFIQLKDKINSLPMNLRHGKSYSTD